MNPTQTTVTPETTPAEILLRAADHIEWHGWNQGSYYSNPSLECPAACAAGAIAIAVYGEPVTNPTCRTGAGAPEYATAFYWLQEYLNATLDQPCDGPIGVYAWNDSPHTSGADVIDTLTAAADAWDAQYGGGDRS